LPETRRVVIPIKLEFRVSVGFIHKESVTMHGHTLVKILTYRLSYTPQNTGQNSSAESYTRQTHTLYLQSAITASYVKWSLAAGAAPHGTLHGVRYFVRTVQTG